MRTTQSFFAREFCLPKAGWKWVAGACAKCGAPREKGARCKPCRRVVLREWYAKNPKRFYEAKQRYKARHPERVARQAAEYKQRRATKVREAMYASRAKTKGVPAPVAWTEMDYWRLYHIVQAARCALCGKKDGGLLTVDHIVPISKGGSDDRDNIQLLCGHCNSSKGTRIMSGIAHFIADASAESWS